MRFIRFKSLLWVVIIRDIWLKTLSTSVNDSNYRAIRALRGYLAEPVLPRRILQLGIKICRHVLEYWKFHPIIYSACNSEGKLPDTSWTIYNLESLGPRVSSQLNNFYTKLQNLCEPDSSEVVVVEGLMCTRPASRKGSYSSRDAVQPGEIGPKMLSS